MILALRRGKGDYRFLYWSGQSEMLGEGREEWCYGKEAISDRTLNSS